MSNALINHIAVTAVAEEVRRPWAPGEELFLRENLADLGYDGAARILGRSYNAVKVRQVRRRIPAPSKRDGWYTGNQVAWILCKDIHSILMMNERGIMHFQRLPGLKGILQISQISLFVWAINPNNWVYFDPARVRHPRLRRLIELRRQKWDDEWWTTGEMARYYGVSDHCVNRRILQGVMPAVRWGNWYVKRSDAIANRIYSGSGAGRYEDYWSPKADEFILKARAKGLKYRVIARMMKWSQKRVEYRYDLLKRSSVDRIPVSVDDAMR